MRSQHCASIKVLHIELGRHLYGGAKQVTYLIQALDKESRFEQHLLCAKDSEISKIRFERCRIHPIRYSGDTDLMGAKRLLDAVKRIEPDLIHVHSRRGADIWGAIASKLTKTPAVCTRRVDNIEHRFASYKYRHFDAVISISDGVRKVVSPHCKGVKYQGVIHSAVAQEEYTQQPNRLWLKEKFNVPQNHFVIANFAQYIPRKGQADLIHAMRDVVARFENVTCLLFGKGSQEENYKALIDKYNLHKNVKLCGFTNEVAHLLPNVDVVVHPAYAEGLGVILLQAGASRRAVISTPVGGIPEIIKHNKTGLMISPGDISGMTEAITLLLSHPEKAKALGETLQQRIKTHFSIEKMATEYALLYEQILKG
ncbi:glycosyltransferase family 4 protein [Alteromonas portus]|uniref:Glycosyltransferase family 4 protein n=1 Tax=Alteromonas portus TaxID=2565549 RepID=A0A4U0ZEA5_9ALTE|nr:glycosyltransferase family 4 protein [Alteromonas portus]TKB01230.1 glycosyltransferase family 4 protein [Alteromonas portus]